MPRLVCRSCGRQIYTVAPLESLFAEERRCPRCGALLFVERREVDRRTTIRRENPVEEPGSPDAKERRTTDRRAERRRRQADGTTRSVSRDQAGWTD